MPSNLVKRPPLLRAPRGMVWAASGRVGVAHLLLKNEKGWRQAEVRCGAVFDYRILSIILSTVVGGYSQQPCEDCVAIQWHVANAP